MMWCWVLLSSQCLSLAFELYLKDETQRFYFHQWHLMIHTQMIHLKLRFPSITCNWLEVHSYFREVKLLNDSSQYWFLLQCLEHLSIYLQGSYSQPLDVTITPQKYCSSCTNRVQISGWNRIVLGINVSVTRHMR